MNKLLKVSTLILAVAAALPAAAQQYGSPTRVQGEPLREQRDGEREAPRKPLPVADREQGERGRHEEGRGQQPDRGQHQSGRTGNDPYRYGDRNGWRDDDRRYSDNRNGNGRDDHDRHRDDRGDWRHDRRDDRRDWRHDQRRHASYRYRSPSRYVYPRGYRDRDWRVGYYLPPVYYSSHYYVDYGYYRLPPPPRGYRWIRVNNDVFLVAIHSGLIRDILYGLFY